ncbi:MucB/RseB C-terminal domain-containing protein [Pontibacterium sp.]|jgi:negative regulator of sigma E activity|uniref:MucB/RseB C-terminal domain-containing protein n=1 Tax=Pontibacterium sp. TaxID=2036026 RepID=UPI003566A327
MTDRSIESVSALMDGEVADFELRRTLDKVAEDSEASERWRRYHIARSAMRGETVTATEIDLSSSVMAALNEEEPLVPEVPATTTEQKTSRTHELFWKPLTSMAVAASVTAAVIFGAQNFGQTAPAQLADNRPDYVLPGAVNSGNYVRAQLGSHVSLSSNRETTEPEVIRLSQGLSRYINQHKHLLTSQKPLWNAEWLPKGFSNVRHEVMPDAEVMVFSDGRNSFSVCVERLGRQSVPQGVAQSDTMVAVAKRMDSHFVTVVGDVPLMIAERIASSVSPKRL